MAILGNACAENCSSARVRLDAISIVSILALVNCNADLCTRIVSVCAPNHVPARIVHPRVAIGEGGCCQLRPARRLALASWLANAMDTASC